MPSRRPLVALLDAALITGRRYGVRPGPGQIGPRGGWEGNFGDAGALIRPAALAMIEAYLANGHDVVLPQMLVNPTELARFEACAINVGAQFIERVLMDAAATSVARFPPSRGIGGRGFMARPGTGRRGGERRRRGAG